MINKKWKIILGIAIISIILLIVIALINKTEYYDVEFDSVNGTLVESQKVKKGEKLIEPEDPIKEGYVFIGWYNGNELFDFSLPVEENLVLTAKWKEKEKDVISYVIKFDSQGGSTIENQIVKKNDKVKKPVDPKKSGYIFKGWKKGNKIYDFETKVTSDLLLTADWEKEDEKEQVTNPPKNNTPVNNNVTSSTPTAQTKIELVTPVITKDGFGVNADGSIGAGFLLNSVEGITGVEVYVSTSKNGTYKLNKTILVGNLSKERWLNVPKGQHLYYKVRTYVSNAQGKFYSNYSNIIDIDNSLATPTITKQTLGVSADGTLGIRLTLDSVEYITGFEVYVSTSPNGTYTLDSTVLDVSVYKGQHLYYKVRTYVSNAQGKFYSNYSNVIEVDNSLSTPNITRQTLGASADGSIGVGLVLDDNSILFSTGVEVYSSTSSNGTYTLNKTISIGDLANGNTAEMHIYSGQHLYYKVRTYANNAGGKFYSNYSNIIEVDNS